MRSLLVALALAATVACARSKAAVESSADPGATGAPAASGSVPPDTTPPAPPSSPGTPNTMSSRVSRFVSPERPIAYPRRSPVSPRDNTTSLVFTPTVPTRGPRKT